MHAHERCAPFSQSGSCSETGVEDGVAWGQGCGSRDDPTSFTWMWATFPSLLRLSTRNLVPGASKLSYAVNARRAACKGVSDVCSGGQPGREEIGSSVGCGWIGCRKEESVGKQQQKGEVRWRAGWVNTRCRVW